MGTKIIRTKVAEADGECGEYTLEEHTPGRWNFRALYVYWDHTLGTEIVSYVQRTAEEREGGFHEILICAKYLAEMKRKTREYAEMGPQTEYGWQQHAK